MSRNEREFFLGALLPGGFVLLAVVQDLAKAIPARKPLGKGLFNKFCAPFQNFLTIEDIVNPVYGTAEARRFVLRARILNILASIALAGWIGCFVYGAILRDTDYALRALVAIFTWISIRPPSTVPYVLFAFACTHFLFFLVEFGFDLMEKNLRGSELALDLIGMIIPGIFVWVAGALPLQAVPSIAFSCPEDDVTLWSWCTFSFIQPIFDLAMTRTLNDTDIWILSPYFQHKNIFNKCLEYRALHPTHSLLRFLLVSNSLDLILDIVLELWSAVVAADDRDAKSTAYFWALVTFLAHLSFAQVDLFQSWHTRRCYERTRGQLFCSLHYKSLKRQDISGQVGEEGDDHKSADLGKIVNLMQGDTYAVAQRFWEFSGLFMSPIRLIIALVFLYQILGWSALSGVVVILLAYVVNYPLATYNISITRSSWKAKDTRMNVVNELLQNIRFLKFYGWGARLSCFSEDFLNANLSQNTTGQEKLKIPGKLNLQWRVKQNTVDTLISFIWTWIPSATALTSFFCYTFIAGERLTSIALFTQLQEPMTALPGQIFAMLHAYVSMQRIEGFLNENEVPEWASTLTAHTSNNADHEVGFSSATFEWPSAPKSSASPGRFELGPLDIKFPKGKLTLVTGATGSGKSALLAALLGGLEHATIRDNIVFSSPNGFDEARYNAVIEACALARDLEVFDAGDQTEIGEKGITLSGGQRARVALARAMYSAAKCILLDDPLAAVDMHTAQHLLTKCLMSDLARDRTIILVTHHISLCLPAASYLIELSHGKVLRQGSIQDLNMLDLLGTVIEQEDTPADVPHTPENEADLLKGAPAKPMQQAGNGKLIEAEARATGRVSLHTYVFLARWGEAYQSEEALSILTSALSAYPWTGLPSPDVDVTPWLMIYFYISLIGAFSVLFYIALGYYASLQASRSLFVSLLKRLTRAPARFFDVTPIGRILNRFTTDINTIDGALMNSARNCISGILNFLASFTVILVVVPTFAPFALFIAWLYIRLAPPYIQASRDLRRLESVSLSPAFAGYDELLRGISHIRAFGMENRYQNGFYAKVDKFQSFDHVYWLVNGWLRWRYDCLGSVVVFAATMFALWKGVTNGSTAIVIVQAGIFAEASRQLVKVAAQLELDFNSVERVVEYLDVPQEAPAIIEKNRPPAYWPSSSGDLRIENLVVQYASHLPSVLRDVSFTVRPSEKIGVVGRTGSGKSTLALSLLRMIEPARGSIIIDGIDISTLGLEDLRTRITIISQDVSLFSGTIKSNLDPLDQHTIEECLDVLQRCHLSSLLNHTPSADHTTLLDIPISPGSLSAGEKQLVAIARAILRRTNIIIMDEATSQIDSNLDDQIQQTIREEFAEAIVITIAHRLKTIMDYDRVLVLDDGEVVEFGQPRELMGMTVRAHSRPLEAAATPSLEPDRRRDLADFFDDDLLYTYGYTHDSYETFSPPEHTTFPFGGLFPDETQTRTDGQTRMTTSSTTSTSASETHHAAAAAKPTHTPSKATPTTSVLPSASPSPVTDAAEAMHASDAKQWKVIGLIIICITFVGAAILTTVFFDAWWGFLRALVCRRRRGGGKEDMVPDWGKQSWEYKLPAEDGNRYQSATSLENIKREIGEGNGTAVGMGGGMGRGPAMGVEKLVNPFDSHPRGLIVSPQPFYNPHPLEPLVRRPSLSQRSPHAFP
ncbi:ATP-binding cassette transporter [Lyophyllum atratum]|nr:ATP-binding cassette transporter [Lyophyllum atratum]